MKSILILDNIRSAENVGSLFRTADAVGVTMIYLVGITPTPLDRFGRPSTKVAKTALGAQLTVPWEYCMNSVLLIDRLKKEGVRIIAIEQSTQSVDYKTVPITGPVAFILGNEVDGLSSKVVEAVDVIAEIPMKGDKESLNVAVAGGVALFRMMDH